MSGRNAITLSRSRSAFWRRLAGVVGDIASGFAEREGKALLPVVQASYIN